MSRKRTPIQARWAGVKRRRFGNIKVNVIIERITASPIRFRKRVTRKIPWSLLTEEERAAILAAMEQP